MGTKVVAGSMEEGGKSILRGERSTSNEGLRVGSGMFDIVGATPGGY